MRLFGRPIKNGPGLWDDTEVILQRRGLPSALLASVVVLVVLLVAGTLVGLRCSTNPRAAARMPAAWEVRREALREQLKVEPGDERAQVQLAGALIWQATQDAQRAHPTERAATPADAAALETWSDEAVRRSPRLAEAHRLAEGVAKHGRDRRQRGAAWALLATIERLEGNDEGRLACMEEAAREDPSYREGAAFLKEHSRSEAAPRW
jgi:hypothetical protein